MPPHDSAFGPHLKQKLAVSFRLVHHSLPRRISLRKESIQKTQKGSLSSRLFATKILEQLKPRFKCERDCPVLHPHEGVVQNLLTILAIIAKLSPLAEHSVKSFICPAPCDSVAEFYLTFRHLRPSIKGLGHKFILHAAKHQLDLPFSIALSSALHGNHVLRKCE